MTESYLSKDILNVSLDRDVFVDHGNLFSVEHKLSLVHIYSFPELMYGSLDGGTDLSDTLHFLHGRVHALSLTKLVQLLDAILIRYVVFTMHTVADVA